MMSHFVQLWTLYPDIQHPILHCLTAEHCFGFQNKEQRKLFKGESRIMQKERNSDWLLPSSLFLRFPFHKTGWNVWKKKTLFFAQDDASLLYFFLVPQENLDTNGWIQNKNTQQEFAPLQNGSFSFQLIVTSFCPILQSPSFGIWHFIFVSWEVLDVIPGLLGQVCSWGNHDFLSQKIKDADPIIMRQAESSQDKRCHRENLRQFMEWQLTRKLCYFVISWYRELVPVLNFSINNLHFRFEFLSRNDCWK